MKFKINPLSGAVLSALMLSPAITLAEDDIVDIGSMTVTGILPDALETVPGTYTIIDEYELEQRRPFTIKEALRGVPGVNVVDEDSFGLNLNIGVRGLNPRRTSRTLLMEDGMPLFLAPYGDPSAHHTTPLDRVQRIEVVKGSGQVLYGPQTIGGMINFVTKPVPTDGLEGSVTSTFGNNNFRGLHGNVGFGGEAGGIMFDALQKKGDGVRDNHQFDVKEYTLKGQLNVTDRHTLIAKGSYYEEDSNISDTGLGAVEYAEDRFQAPTGKNDRFELERKTAQLKHIFDINDRVTLTSQAYYVDTYRTSFRQTNDPGGADGRSIMDRCPGLGVATEQNANLCGGRHRPRDYEYWGLESRLDFSHNLFGLENDAVVGLRYHEEDIRRRQFRDSDPRAQSLSFIKSFGQDFLREDVRIDTQAISYYAQNTFYLNDWSFTPGLRVEDVRQKTSYSFADGNVQNNPESQFTNNNTKVLPGFGVAWNGIENTTIFAGVHKGFAPPRPNRDIDAPGGANTLDARNLKTDPEESTNYEIGVRSAYFNGIAFESALFYTDFDEIVVQREAGFFTNGGESKQAGLELAGRIDFGTIYNTTNNIYLVGSYTNLFKAEFSKTIENDGIQSGNRLPYAPRHLASLAVGYEHISGFDGRIGVDYVGRQFVDVENTRTESIDGQEGTISSYSLVNASVNYRKPGSPVTLFASVYNLTDRNFLVSRVDGKVAGRERQFFGGIRYDF